MKKITFSKSRFLFLLVGGMSLSLSAQVDIEREAENADEISYVSISDKSGFSGAKGIDMKAAYGAHAKFEINVTAAGTYDLEIDYSTMNERFLYVAVNEQLPSYLAFSDLTSSWEGLGEGGLKTKTQAIYLEAGDNTIEIGAFEDLSSSTKKYIQDAPCIDKIRIKTSATTIAKPSDRITPIVVQGEDFTSSTGSGKSENFSDFRTGKGGKIGEESSYGSLKYENINVTEAGTYDLSVCYASMDIRSFFVKVNNQKAIRADLIATSKSWGDSTGEGDIEDDNGVPYSLARTVQVYLEAGDNTITLGGIYNAEKKHDHGINLDRLVIRNSPKSITKPADVRDAYVADYTDIAVSIVEETKTTKNNLNNLFDNDETTLYLSDAPTQITVELPYPIIVTSYSLATGQTYDISNLKIERYTGSGWMEMNATTELNAANNPMMKGSVSVFTTWLDLPQKDRASKTYRLTASGSNIAIGEWQINGFPCFSTEAYFPKDLTTDDNSTLQGTWKSTNNGLENFGEVFANLYDKNAGTKYTVEKRAIDFDFTFNSPAEVVAYSIGNANNIHERAPKNWMLRGYMGDSDETGVELDIQTGVIFPPSRSNLVFPIKNTGEYTKYKLIVTQNNGSGMTQFTQFQLLGVESFPTSIETPAIVNEKDAEIYSTEGGVIIKAKAQSAIVIYNLLGQLMYVGECNGDLEVALSKGIYVVKVNNNIEKVLVQ